MTLSRSRDRLKAGQVNPAAVQTATVALGEAKAAKRETDLLLRACWSRDFFFGNVMIA